MKTIVHISADFPDPFAPNKTAAVANLVDGAPGFRHIVYSLNRVSGLSGLTASRFDQDRVCLIYRAPPWSLLLRSRLEDVADWIRDDLVSAGIRPDVVHAHKFTIEGVIGLRLKKAFGRPLICNIQGNSDTAIAQLRPDLRPIYRTLARESAAILSFAPWCGPAMERILGEPLRHEVLPVGTTCDALLPPIRCATPRLVSLFHLDAWRGKGADTMATAVTRVARHRPEVSLDIYGGGSPRHTRALQASINRRADPGRVRLMGPLARERVQATLNTYSAFVMPSHRETYGLAFVEALFSCTRGLPAGPCHRRHSARGRHRCRLQSVECPRPGPRHRARPREPDGDQGADRRRADVRSPRPSAAGHDHGALSPDSAGGRRFTGVPGCQGGRPGTVRSLLPEVLDVIISIFGLGYVGTVSAACLSDRGHRVIGVDTNQHKVDAINQGTSPIVEPGLEYLLGRAIDTGRLTATRDATEAVMNSDLSLLCVGTPSNPNGSLNLDQVLRVSEQIGAVLKSKDRYHGIAVRSTVLPGTIERVTRAVEHASGKRAPEGFGVASNPEFLREGTSIVDLEPPFTVVGADDDRSRRCCVS